MRFIDHPYDKDSINKYVVPIYKEEDIYFKQVFWILILVLLINQPQVNLYFHKLLKYKIHSKLTYSYLGSLFKVTMNAFFIHL